MQACFFSSLCPNEMSSPESDPGCRKSRGFKPPSRHFFFFRLDLPARPALSVILPCLYMQVLWPNG